MICDGGAITPCTPCLFKVSVAGSLNSSFQTRSLALSNLGLPAEEGPDLGGVLRSRLWRACWRDR